MQLNLYSVQLGYNIYVLLYINKRFEHCLYLNYL